MSTRERYADEALTLLCRGYHSGAAMAAVRDLGATQPEAEQAIKDAMSITQGRRLA